MGISASSLLSIVGGIPLSSPFDSAMASNPVVAAKKLVARNLALPVGMQSLLPQLMQGGIGSILTNPMGAAMGALNGVIGGAVGQLTGALGGGFGGLTNALTNTLGSSLSNLSSMTNLMSGLTIPDLGQTGGLMDVMNHASLTSVLGSALPASLGLDKVLGPLNMGNALGSMGIDIGSMVADVIDGKLPVADAIMDVTNMAASIDNVIHDATTALQSGQAVGAGVASLAAVTTLLGSASGPIQAFADSLVSPTVAAEVKAAISDLFG